AAGTLELRAAPHDLVLPSACRWDARTACFRAPAVAYAEVVTVLHRAGVSYDDAARRYVELGQGLIARREPRPYQSEALDAWQAARGRGVVVLPTGSGKSHVA